MQKLIVHPLLTDIIDHAILTETEGIESYRVSASIYTVIGFQFSGQIHHMEENRPLDTLGVTGILDRWRPFRSEAATRSLLIFLKPGGFYRIFGAVAGSLKSNSLALADVTSVDMKQTFNDILMATGHISEKWNRLQERFLKLVCRNLSPESRGALYFLQTQKGLLRIESIAKNLGVSRRTLERKFMTEIGTSPKHLARIFRWENALRNLGNSSDLGTTALECGYFDQAHFVRESQNLSGTSPKKLKLLGF